jgi:tetratricopeptide (TPR) repeat protein
MTGATSSLFRSTGRAATLLALAAAWTFPASAQEAPQAPRAPGQTWTTAFPTPVGVAATPAPALPWQAYLGIGLDSPDMAQYEALGSYFDWGKGPLPGGGMLISFVDPACEAFRQGVVWGDLLLGVGCGGDPPRNVVSLAGFDAIMARVRPGAPVTLHVFRQGEVHCIPTQAQRWPREAQERWPDREGRSLYYFPWLKDREALVDYRVSFFLRKLEQTGDPLALKDVADTYFLTNRFDQALLAYETYIQESEPTAQHYPALYAMAYAAREAGQPEQGAETAAEAVALWPSSSLALYEWSRSLYATARFDGAMRCVENALTLLPRDKNVLRADLELWRQRIAEQISASLEPVETPWAEAPPSIILAPKPAQAKTPARIIPPTPVQTPFRTAPPAPTAPPWPPAPTPEPVQLQIESVRSLLPAHPGSSVVIVLDYQVAGLPLGEMAMVSESISLVKDEKSLRQWRREIRRGSDSFRMTAFYRIPKDLTVGDYSLQATVSSGRTEVFRTANLSVSSEK